MSCLFKFQFLIRGQITTSVIGRETYLTEPFVCAITSCADYISRKTRPQFLTHPFVDDRHIHHSQLINSFTSSYSFSPSRHLTHFILVSNTYIHIIFLSLSPFEAQFQINFCDLRLFSFLIRFIGHLFGPPFLLKSQ